MAPLKETDFTLKQHGLSVRWKGYVLHSDISLPKHRVSPLWEKKYPKPFKFSHVKMPTLHKNYHTLGDRIKKKMGI